MTELDIELDHELGNNDVVTTIWCSTLVWYFSLWPFHLACRFQAYKLFLSCDLKNEILTLSMSVGFCVRIYFSLSTSVFVNICVSSSVCVSVYVPGIPGCLCTFRERLRVLRLRLYQQFASLQLWHFSLSRILVWYSIKLNYKPQPWNQFWSQKEPLSVCWRYKEVLIFFRYDRWPLQMTRS